MSKIEDIDENRIACRFNGIPVKVRDQMILEVLLEETVAEDGEVKRIGSFTSTEICNKANIQHRTQLHRSRERLEEAGLIDTKQDPDDSDSPLNPPTRIRATPAAVEHQELLTRSPSDLSLEERVAELEEELEENDEAIQEIREELEFIRPLLEEKTRMAPDEFVFDE